MWLKTASSVEVISTKFAVMVMNQMCGIKWNFDLKDGERFPFYPVGDMNMCTKFNDNHSSRWNMKQKFQPAGTTSKI